jgi:hypothetical protein
MQFLSVYMFASALTHPDRASTRRISRWCRQRDAERKMTRPRVVPRRAVAFSLRPGWPAAAVVVSAAAVAPCVLLRVVVALLTASEVRRSCLASRGVWQAASRRRPCGMASRPRAGGPFAVEREVASGGGAFAVVVVVIARSRSLSMSSLRRRLTSPRSCRWRRGRATVASLRGPPGARVSSRCGRLGWRNRQRGLP